MPYWFDLVVVLVIVEFCVLVSFELQVVFVEFMFVILICLLIRNGDCVMLCLVSLVFVAVIAWGIAA